MFMNDFGKAMLTVCVEDAVGRPCVGCGIPGTRVGIWTPTSECLRREFKIDDDLWRACVYPLCLRCARKAKRSKTFCRKIEDAVIAKLRERHS